jgi:predicted metal-dependent hydrolase
MAKVRTLDIEGVGPVLFERSKRAKTVNVFVKPVESVRVAVPRGVSFEKAREVVRSKSDWIKRELAKMQKARREYRPRLNRSVDIENRTAYNKLAGRIEELAAKHGLTYGKLRIRKNKAQWGSCSRKNNISLNIKLALLPAELIDYVMLHELTHTRLKNHSGRFWAELDRFFGDARAVDARLKEYILEWI